MNEQITFLFMDYETFNLNPKGGRASQFAAIRTNYNLDYVTGSAVNYFCEQASDNIPSPKATMITKITPQKIVRIKNKEEKILPSKFDAVLKVFNEYDFSRCINEVMSIANTCTLGYNSVKFDDEYSRNLFYRNLFDPYAREWKNGNSRFDVYYLVIATFVLKPRLLNFPNAIDKESKLELIHSITSAPLPSFRLEELSIANGIIHTNAHDAFSDVEATLELMKKIKLNDEYFFEEMFAFRKKSHVVMWLEKNRQKPFIHISQYYGREKNSFAIVYYITANDRSAICLDLSCDVSPLIELEDQALNEFLFPKNSGVVTKEVKKHGVVTITFNQCPMLANSLQYVDRMKEFRLDSGVMRSNLDLIKSNIELLKVKLSKIYFKSYDSKSIDSDIDLQIYEGGFFNDDESNSIRSIHSAIRFKDLKMLNLSSSSQRIQDMVFRIKGRNFPETLNSTELTSWKMYSKNRLTDKTYGAELILDEYYNELKLLRDSNLNEEDISVLNELDEYVNKLKLKHSI
jgi:exodeoxyribonuclease-1